MYKIIVPILLIFGLICLLKLKNRKRYIIFIMDEPVNETQYNLIKRQFEYFLAFAKHLKRKCVFQDPLQIIGSKRPWSYYYNMTNMPKYYHEETGQTPKQHLNSHLYKCWRFYM